MIEDNVGQLIASEQDIIDLIMSNRLDVVDNGLLVDSTVNLDNIVDQRESANLARAVEYDNVELFDQMMQSNWYMPDEYKSLNIAEYVLGLCKGEAEVQRAGHELLLYQERDLFDLLRYCVYLVDTMRNNNIIWGVGRGSSVSSFVLYLLGVHRVNSLHYDLPAEEFLR